MFRRVYDGLGRIIRKDQPDVAPPGATYVPVRSNDYYYDGIRRIADVVRVPTVAEAPPPCEEFHAVTRSPGTSGEWIRSNGLSIGVEIEACQPTIGSTPVGGSGGGIGPPLPEDPGGPGGPGFEQWTDREYVYDPSGDLGGVDQFILQVSRDGPPVYMHQNVSLDVVALTSYDGAGAVIPIRQDLFSPYGEIVAGDIFTLRYLDNPVGFKGLFFDRFTATPGKTPLEPGPQSGVYQNRNRSYSPTLGRFLQRDPNETGMPTLGLALGGEPSEINMTGFRSDGVFGDGMDIYLLTAANPVNNSDPLGLSAMDWFDEADAIVVDIAGTRAAMIEELNQQVNTGLEWAGVIGQTLVSLLPAGRVGTLGFAFGSGDDISADDILSALLSFVPGGAFGGKAISRALYAFDKTNKAYQAGKKAQRLVRVTGAALQKLRNTFHNVVKPAYWKYQALMHPEDYSPSQLERMRKGKAPVGSDGKYMEIHHKVPLSQGGSNDFDNLVPMTKTNHQLKGNFRKNHPIR